MVRSTLRLGFYYHIPAVQDGAYVRVPGFFGRFLDSLAEHCAQLTCFLPEAISPPDRRLCDYTVRNSKLAWISLGPPRSTLLCSFLPGLLVEQIKPYLSQIDALLIRGPSPLLPALARAAQQLPVVLLLVGDYQETSAVSSEPVWRKLLIRLWARWYAEQQTQIAHRALTFVNSQSLYHHLRPSVPQLLETRTTTLREGDFFSRADTCLQRPVHILYTGRYSSTKGLFDIVEALALLSHGGEDVILDLVGWPLAGEEDVVDRLLVAAQARGVAEKVVNHGYRPVGPGLFAFYRQADIYVLASHADSLPRTIWEAMANSVPVIATRVGSIPHYLKDGMTAILVSPRRPSEISDAVKELIGNPALRQQLIINARAVVHELTIERQVRAMVSDISVWLRAQAGKSPGVRNA